MTPPTPIPAVATPHDLSALFGRWAREVSPGDGPPTTSISVHAPGQLLGRHRLTGRQTDELVAAVADQDYAAGDAARVADEITKRWPAAGAPSGAMLEIEDITIEDPLFYVVNVPLGSGVLVRRMCRYLTNKLDLLVLGRKTLAVAKYHEEQRVGLAPGELPGWPLSSREGTVAYVKAHLPTRPEHGTLLRFSYFVVLDELPDGMWFTDTELRPADDQAVDEPPDRP